MNFEGVLDRAGALFFFTGLLSLLYSIVHSSLYNFTLNHFMLNGGILGIVLMFASITCVNAYLDSKEAEEKKEMKSRIEELEEKLDE